MYFSHETTQILFCGSCSVGSNRIKAENAANSQQHRQLDAPSETTANHHQSIDFKNVKHVQQIALKTSRTLR